MKNIKYIAISSVAGFILSFFFGLFSHSNFIKIFLTALLFAIIFGILSILITFLYSKFLDVNGGDYESQPVVAGGRGVGVAGTKVDIVISESELEQTGNSNHYDVGSNKQMLNDSDILAKDSSSDDYSPRDGFVPLRNLETVSNFSGVEATENIKTKQNRAGSKSANSNLSSLSGSLDELPDMGDTSFLQSSGNSDETEMLSENSDFISSALKYKEDNDGNIQDASLMAKAISSILSEET